MHMFENYRRYQRYSFCARARITRRSDPRESWTAQVSTISQGGMGFYSDVLPEKAAPVSIELLAGADGGTGILEGKIASVCSLGEDYFVGVSFDSDISYDRFVELIG